MYNTIPKVSIIVPVFNAGKYLQKCLETLQAQTMKELEIILILDCPTDGSDVLAKNIAAHDNRFIIVENSTNKHIGLSRNIGIAKATGEYIGFSDHDDYRELDMYEQLYKKAKETDADIVVSIPQTTLKKDDGNIEEFPVFEGNSERKNYCLDNLLSLGGLSNNNSPFATIHGNLYRRSLLLDNHLQFIDTKIITPEDYIFNVSVFHKASNIQFINKKFYFHITHTHNTGNESFYRDYKFRGPGLEFLYRQTQTWGDLDKYQQALYRGLSKQAIHILATAFCGKNYKHFIIVRNYFRKTSCFQEALKHYDLPNNKVWYKQLFRHFLLWNLTEPLRKSS